MSSLVVGAVVTRALQKYSDAPTSIAMDAAAELVDFLVSNGIRPEVRCTSQDQLVVFVDGKFSIHQVFNGHSRDLGLDLERATREWLLRWGGPLVRNELPFLSDGKEHALLIIKSL